MQPDRFFISGIQQVGIGTSSVDSSWKWFADMFGMDIEVARDNAISNTMTEYTGGHPRRRDALIAANLQGGACMELWQSVERKPKAPAFPLQIGDLGIFVVKIKCSDVDHAHEYVRSKYDRLTEIAAAPDGSRSFFIQDPEGNWFQAIEDSTMVLDEGKPFGGVVGCMIGVSDMDAARKLYSDILGYNKVIYNEYGHFDDFALLPGGTGEFRRTLVCWSKRPVGALSNFLPTGFIEFVQCRDREPQKIFKDRYWGDLGFIHLSFDVTNLNDLKTFCEEKGYHFVAQSNPDGNLYDFGDTSCRFAFIEDRDGLLVQFVEPCRICLSRRWKLFVSLIFRKREKPLWKFHYRLMRTNRKHF